MDVEYTPDEIASLEAEEDRDELADRGAEDEPTQPFTIVWPMEFNQYIKSESESER